MSHTPYICPSATRPRPSIRQPHFAASGTPPLPPPPHWPHGCGREGESCAGRKSTPPDARREGEVLRPSHAGEGWQGSWPAARRRRTLVLVGAASRAGPHPWRGVQSAAVTRPGPRPRRGRVFAGASSSPDPRPSASRDRPPSRAVVIAGPSSSLGDHNKVRLGFLWC